MFYLGVGPKIEAKEEGVRYLSSAEIKRFCQIQVDKTRDKMKELNDWRSASLQNLRDVVLK